MATITLVNLSAIDLNLLLVLATVLEEGSATRAAARLHVTQSAVSNALARLRRVFDDPLLVRGPGGLVPTPRALAIAPRLAGAMETLRGVVHGETFDPRTTTRRFTIACTDLVAALLVPELGARLRAKMPLASLRIVTIEHMMARDGLATGDVDLLVGVPPTVPTGCIAEPVYDDTLVCIVARTHPTLQRAKRLDVVTYAALPHVEIALFGEANRIVDVALARIGSARKVVVAVPHFTLAPLVVARSDAVATLGKKLATTYAKMLPLRVLGAPIPLPAIRVKQMWHVRSANDAGTSALRDLVRRALRLSPRRTRADTAPGDS